MEHDMERHVGHHTERQNKVHMKHDVNHGKSIT